jgi:hypothetical protein
VEDLRGQLSVAEQRTRDAERRAQEASQVARDASAEVKDTRASAIDTEIASAATESTSLKAQLKAAWDAGDFEKATELQEKIADVRARLYDANKEKARIAQEVQRPHEGAVRQRTREEQRQAMLDACTPASRAWLESHPECIDNPVKNSKAIAAHNEAIHEKGLAADTPDYFRFIEEQLGYSTVNTKAKEPRNGTTRKVVESAPVDRGGGGSSGSEGGQKVELTRGELAAATDGTVVWNTGPNKGKPVGAKEYARRKLIGMQEGRYAAPATQ